MVELQQATIREMAIARLILGEETALGWVHDFNLNTFDL
jgi:hypothetical protein